MKLETRKQVICSQNSGQEERFPLQKEENEKNKEVTGLTKFKLKQGKYC